jgi:hypothetical protein
MSTTTSALGRATALLLLLTSIPSLACAADTHGKYRVLTIDSVETCSDLNNAVATADVEDDWRQLYAFSVYTMGYLTGINRLAFDTYDIAGGKNVKIHMVWLQRYCAANPGDSFDLALFRLVAELYPRRAATGPSPEDGGK